MRLAALAAVVLAAVAGCSTGSPSARSGSSPAAESRGATWTISPGTHLGFGQLRSRSLRTTPLAPGAGCPVSKLATIRFESTSLPANGTPPFLFGLWGPTQTSGDWSKTPWRVEVGYSGRLLVRGGRIDGSGAVNFGFWPRGFGTPAEQVGVPVAFIRPDQEGRPVVYQPELDIEAPAGGSAGGGFWSFPSAGCYAIQADGDTFTHVTVIRVL